MRRVLVLLSVFCAAGLLLPPCLTQPGVASALTIGPITFPDFDSPDTHHNDKSTVVARPPWMPELSAAQGDTVIVIPGTTDYDAADQLERTRDIGLFGVVPGHRPAIRVVNYPAAFGITIGDFPIYLAGDGTFNESVDVGTAKGVAAAEAAYDPSRPDQTIVLNGYSQSAPVAMNIAYMLRKRGTVPADRILVVVGADSRFPNTGVENVVPSFLPGMYTNGDRDAAATGDIAVRSYCVRGDATCGVGNPLANPASTLFYLLPGFYVHAFLNSRINEYKVEKTWDDGHTHYVVYNGGNPWGMMLRDRGVPVPRTVDDLLDTAVPVPMPGEQATSGGRPVPTPRELQDIIFARLGWTVPVTDPDRNSATEQKLRDDTTADDSTPAPAQTNHSTPAPAPAPATTVDRRPSLTAPNHAVATVRVGGSRPRMGADAPW
ncbi:hypothetical protein ACWDTI_02050 [Gordonia sp. NPDC003424]